MVIVIQENPHPSSVDPIPDVFAGRHVFFPEDGEEERTGGVHDRDVGEAPVAVIILELVDHVEEKRVLRGGSHGVVRNSRWFGAMEPGWVSEEGVEAAVAALKYRVSRGGMYIGNSWRQTYIIQVEVRAAEVNQNEVADSVCALDAVRVPIVGVKEPVIFGLYELAG